MLKKSIFLFIICTSFINCNKNQDETIVFKFGHLANENHIWHKTALHFSEYVKTKSNGKMIVNVYPNEQLGKELDMITGILAGTVDMTITGESLQNWAPKACLCATPYAIRDSDHLAKVAGGEIGKEIETEIQQKVGLRPLAWFERGARHLTSNRPIKHPNDLNGLILRVPNVPLFVKTWQSLGAKPTPMSFSEVFTALQQGTIHAQENPLALIKSAGFYEVQDYCNLTHHVIGWIYVVMGDKKFQSLPSDLQTILLQAGKDMQTFHQEIFSREQENLARELKQNGMTFVDVDQKAFQEKAKNAVINNLTSLQKALYQQIIEINN